VPVEPGRPLPRGIGAPAIRALTAAGYPTLDALTRVSATHLLALHGVGLRAIRVLREQLAETGDDLAD
jgi:hypothetical protein